MVKNPTLAERLSLRPETGADEPIVMKMYASTRSSELEMLPWNEWQKADFVKMQHIAQHTHYVKEYNTERFDIILLDGQPAGRLYIEEKEDQLLLVDIIVLPEYQQQGIGGYYMEQLLEEAAEKQKKVALHVYSDSWVRELYLRLGFEEKGGTDVHTYMEWHPAVEESADES